MKKINLVLTILVATILMFLTSSVKAAEDGVDFFLAKEIEIQSTTSTYNTGTILTITLKNEDGNVQLNDIPELIIQFGNGEEIEIKSDTEPGTLQALQYTYTIKENDIGKLKILREQQTIADGKTSMSLDHIKLNKDIIANSDKDTGEGGDGLTWTNFDNVKFEWTDYTETDHSTPSLSIKNVEFNTENHYYYYHISHNKDENPDLAKIGEDLEYWQNISSDKKISSIGLTSYLETNGDIYIWIAEVQNREQKIVLNAKKVERLEQLPLTKRIVGYFSDSFAGGIFCYEPHTSKERKLNIKMGKMTDKSILKAIKENETNAMKNLLNYAKASDYILEETYDFREQPTVPETAKIEDKGYYFVYFELEDENGKYYPVEDVELYQASVTGNKVQLINYTDRNFVYDIDDDIDIDTKNNTVDNTIAGGKIPQTGATAMTISVITVLAIVAGYIAYKTAKYRDIK